MIKRLKQAQTPPMHRALLDFVEGDELHAAVLTQVIVSKLEAATGVSIEPYADLIKQQVRKRLLGEDGLTWAHTFELDVPELTGHQALSIDDSEVDALVAKMPGIVEKATEQLTESMSAELLKHARASATEVVENRARELGSFRARLHTTWSKPLDLLALQLFLCTEFGGEITTWLRSQATSEDAELVEAMLRLHSRCCQIAGEIELLLAGGYGDGALARWRTLHEVATVAMFLQEHGNNTAKRYLDHMTIDSLDYARKEAAAASDHDGSLEKSLQVLELEAEVDSLKSKYGKTFANEYGWAAEALNNPNPNFSHIEKAISLEKMRPLYKIASSTVHAGPKGAFWKLGLLYDQDRVLLAGPSNAGLAEAGRLTAMSMAQVSAALIVLHPVLDSTVWATTIFTIANDVAEAFQKVEEHLAIQEGVLPPKHLPLSRKIRARVETRTNNGRRRRTSLPQSR